MKFGSATLALIACLTGTASAQHPETAPTEILQLYTYELTDRAMFEQGYREHLAWHVAHQDQLVWYAWTVQSGVRRGLFIDGTAGATFADLDARPDPQGDAADFARTAASHAIPINVETWQLWQAPSTGTPLEDLRPSALVDVFHLRARPEGSDDFEELLEAAAQQARQNGLVLSWYRQLRGGEIQSYMIMVPRATWDDIGSGSATLRSLLANAYSLDAGKIDALLESIVAAHVETWSYAPRLSLMPGDPVLD